MKRVIFLFGGLFGIVLCAYLFIHAKSFNDTQTAETYQIKAIKLPNYLTFAGERVPLEKPDVKERVDREFLVNTYWQSNALLLIKRAHKYFPIIEPILESYEIPDDFKYLAVIESGLLNVSSPAGAKGFWQIMKGTAKDYKLEVNSNVDERYHIEKSTKVAYKFLKKQYKKFGSWTLAAASYNVGPTGLHRRMKQQQVLSYYDLLLPEETGRYVPRIVAVKTILESPESYGFVYDENDLYQLPELHTVKVDTAISNLARFSKQMDVNYKELKLYNPWLRENRLINVSGKSYEILIPAP